jgi:hypothetical protein
MSSIETINIDVYPWATPTDAQCAWFHALSPEEKREAIRRAIEEGYAQPNLHKIDRRHYRGSARRSPTRYRLT